MSKPDVEIVSPSTAESISGEPEPGLSIHRVAKALGLLLSGLEISRVQVCSAARAERNPDPKIARILCCFRPYDIKAWYRRLNFTHVVLLLHEQDKVGQDINHAKEILKDKKVIVVSNDSKEYLEGIGVNVDGVVNLPYGSSKEFPKKVIKETVTSLSMPSVTLWTGPHTRKNSLYGLYALLDAGQEYGKNFNATIMCMSSVGEESIQPIRGFLRTAPQLSNMHYDVISCPDDRERDRILATSTTVVMPTFDEGYHIPIREAARFKTDIVTSDIPVNRELRKLTNNVRTIQTESREIVGAEMDEFPMGFQEMNVPKYGEMVSQIVKSMKSWEKIKNIKTKSLKNGSFYAPLQNPKLDQWTEAIGVKKRKTPGMAVFNVI